MFRIEIIQVEMLGVCRCVRCESSVGLASHCLGSKVFAQKFIKVCTMERACDEVWYFACRTPSSVVRLVRQWRWPMKFCKNSWTARFGSKAIRTWRISCCDAVISRSWRGEALSGAGFNGGIFVRSMVEPIQRDWPLCRGSLSGRTHA